MSFLSSKVELASVRNCKWHSLLQALPYLYDLKYNLLHIKHVFFACVHIPFYILKGQSNAIVFYVPAWLAETVVLFQILWRKYILVTNSVCEVSSRLRIGRALKFSFSLCSEVLCSRIYTDPSIIRTLVIGIPRSFELFRPNVAQYFPLNLLLQCIIIVTGARGGAVGWGTALQAGRSRVLFPMVSLEFFIDIILKAALWPWGWLSL